MPENFTVTHTAYQFDELSDEAKERAREWYRDGLVYDDWWDYVYEDFKQVAEHLGFEDATDFSFDADRGRYFHFTGTYRLKRDCVEAITRYAPQDATLKAIAEQLIQAQVAWKLAHQTTVHVLVKDGKIDAHPDDDSVNTDDVGWSNIEDRFNTLLKDLEYWVLKQLDAEYEDIHSDECVDENIRANKYTFDEDGKRLVIPRARQ